MKALKLFKTFTNIRHTLAIILTPAAIITMTSSNLIAVELSISDFKFDGEFGSDGAQIEKVGTNHFKITFGHPPTHPNWSNFLGFLITGNAQGNSLRIDGCFNCPADQEFKYRFYSDYQSWSYDGENWQPKGWGGSWDGQGGKYLQFPTFTQDQVYVGFQVPMSHEDVLEMIAGWESGPFVTVHHTGQSLLGRNVYRLEITDPDSPYPRQDRWVHWIQNEHPLEQNAQWRIVGMIEWLLSDEGADCRKRSISHFKIMVGPDGPSNGWLRTNAEGVDLNRCYLWTGSDPTNQTHECYIGQKDLETVMASEAPVTDFWTMHTWGGLVDPELLGTGPELDSSVGPWTELRDIIESNDPNDLIEPLEKSVSTGDWSTWSGGPYGQFGVTNFLCEGGTSKPLQGGSIPFTKEDCKQAGAILMKSLAMYYAGTKADPRTYTLGDVTGNGTITATDASLAAQYAVGLITLIPEQIVAADVTGNGTVSAADASWIARKAVDPTIVFPVEQ